MTIAVTARPFVSPSMDEKLGLKMLNAATKTPMKKNDKTEATNGAIINGIFLENLPVGLY